MLPLSCRHCEPLLTEPDYRFRRRNMKKHVTLLMVLTALVLSVMITGCNGSGGQGAVSLASPGTDNGLPEPGSGTDDPGAGSGALPTALAWDAPATNSDGSALTNLAGYKIHYGPSSGNYTGVLDVGLTTSYSLSELPAGTYYFTVTAYNQSGIESERSNEVSKTIEL
jgi:hypothetical protein